MDRVLNVVWEVIECCQMVQYLGIKYKVSVPERNISYMDSGNENAGRVRR